MELYLGRKEVRLSLNILAGLTRMRSEAAVNLTINATNAT
jgi:hypothetical protein